jgi:CubicO group peptidase (beta-lactamase class C family)
VTHVFQAYVDQGELPGAVVLIARHGKLAFFQAFGYQDREKKVAMSKDSIFRIASMTKPITTVAAMMLAEEGKLDLLAPVSAYLPEFKTVQVAVEKQDAPAGAAEIALQPQRRPMTVQDLLRHTAGLVYGPFGKGPVHKAYLDAKVADRDQTLQEMVTKLSKLPLAHQPGDVWEYSMATDVLGRIIEVVSGTELDDFIEQRITKPLGMASTGFYVTEANRDRIAEPQTDVATGKRPSMFDPTKKPKWISGGGGALSTATDYFRFCEMLLEGGKLDEIRLLSPATVDLMTSNALFPGISYVVGPGFQDFGPTPAMGQSFGLGFAIRTAAGQNPLPGSVGSFYWTGATGTTFYIDPKQSLIVVMMIQVPLTAMGPYRRAIHTLAYQALVAPDR